MAKAKKSVFFCQNCGHEESKWLGQCPMCKEWNSFVEECVTTSNTAAVKAAKEIRIVPLSEVKTENEERVTTEIKELDRVLECIILTVNNDFMDAGGYAHEQLQ